jgi:hypothetical protein
VLVAVERDRSAVRLDVPERGLSLKVVERSLRSHDAKLNQSALGVVDEDQQDAPRRALLEPLVLAAVD